MITIIIESKSGGCSSNEDVNRIDGNIIIMVMIVVKDCYERGNF